MKVCLERNAYGRKDTLTSHWLRISSLSCSEAYLPSEFYASSSPGRPAWKIFAAHPSAAESVSWGVTRKIEKYWKRWPPKKKREQTWECCCQEVTTISRSDLQMTRQSQVRRGECWSIKDTVLRSYTRPSRGSKLWPAEKEDSWKGSEPSNASRMTLTKATLTRLWPSVKSLNGIQRWGRKVSPWGARKLSGQKTASKTMLLTKKEPEVTLMILRCLVQV